ncbi:MAG: hypothetical protein KBT88_03540 [Gammaproteobacteria bacterium]|nr:hypothetical protein [Gammaproteobacteria bacterium]MBQ0838834.1 hypothetical protein [Gammaproteobacteria bacterium]
MTDLLTRAQALQVRAGLVEKNTAKLSKIPLLKMIPGAGDALPDMVEALVEAAALMADIVKKLEEE